MTCNHLCAGCDHYDPEWGCVLGIDMTEEDKKDER